MALVSPGVEVTIIDESQYSSAGQNTVPYILVASAENKLTPAGTSIAPGTIASAIGDVYLITSQRELVNTFGNPNFYKTSGGNALHGYELNEYGLMAAYSVLGATNRAYIQRVDVDLAELEASLVRPAGAAADGTYWFDLAESDYGFFAWNSSTNTFDLITPIVITDTADIEVGTVPKTSVGTIGSYAINTISDENPVYRKGTDNQWTLIGSDEWKLNIPTIVGALTPTSVTAGAQLTINGVLVPFAGVTSATTLTALVAELDPDMPAGTAVAEVNGRIEFYADTVGGTLSGDIIIADDTLTLLAELGIDPDTYAGPIVQHDSHVNVPRWRDTDTTPRPSGSVWQKTTAVNDGADIVVKKYNAAQDLFEQQSAPLYATDEMANKFLDPATGGSSIAGGDTYVQYDVENPDLALATGTFKIFVRTAGVTSVTGTTPTITAGTFTISASATNSVVLSTATIVFAGATADDLVTAISAEAIPGVESIVTGTNEINITHTGGGVIYLEDTVGTTIADAGFSTALDNVRSNAAGQLVLSNWNVLNPYTADTVAPGQDPLNGTRWYYSAVDEIDIMIHDGGVWKGYRNLGNGATDARGHDLSATDPLGPTVSATAPTKQQDGVADLQWGDLWIDTSDLEEYATIRRYEADENAINGWVLIDNADQTSINGVLFADARWDITGTTDPVTGEIPSIVAMLSDDWIDPDAPDDALYPDGMLLWNTRRSGYNVKEFRVNYFNNADFDLTDWGLAGATEANAWVTVSGLKEDGSANFGRLAQRNLVVQAMKAAVDTNSDIREEQRQFNLIAAPGYPELLPNMVALNNERSNTAFVIGDTPMRLANNGTDIATWASNNNGVGVDTNDGLSVNDEYMGVFYPSGRTNDLTGTSVVVPASHMILRTIIHSDEQSYPWLAPAGVRRGQVDNVDAIGYIDGQSGEFVQMSTREGIRDVLYTNNVNPITFIPGAGIVNYGNLTTKEGSALDRINVSRLVSYVRIQVDALGKLFVFEPNDKLTRDELKGQMERMLNDLVAKRGIYDYIVVCDKSNNTNVRIDRNEIWVDIAIEPVKSGEFVFVPVRIKNTGEISGG